MSLHTDENDLVVAVSDSGVGIAPEFLPHVFDPFRQGDATTTRRHSGLGLGLAITRHLVDLHGGVLNAASEGVGRGATFTLRFPLASAPPEVLRDLRLRSAPHGERVLSGVKVLVVDDDVDARDLMHELFTSAGAHVTLASGGVEALTTLRAIAPDVIVSDIGMPEMDGFELIKRIRQWPEPDIAGMPAIALSAYLRQQDESAAAGSGFNAFQPKPLNVVALLETIMTLTKRRVGTR